jgi:hypothetical protein
MDCSIFASFRRKRESQKPGELLPPHTHGTGVTSQKPARIAEFFVTEKFTECPFGRNVVKNYRKGHLCAPVVNLCTV